MAYSKKLTLTIGVKDTERRKAALLKLAEAVHAIGKTKAASISELVIRLADSADYDLEKTVEVWEKLPQKEGETPG